MAYGKSKDEVYLADGFESLTITNAAAGVGPSAARSKTAYKAFMTAEDAEMRFRFDGTAPSSTEGHLIDDGDTLELYGNKNIVNFLAIRTGDDSGVLKITYYAH